VEHVVLVDEQDREIGTMEKMEAHRQGILHRAFSILVYNSNGELLIQKRAAGKYHSAGLWTNACCSHPRPDEPLQEATARRLSEEMGIIGQPEFDFKFLYRVNLDNELIEHELDHVFTLISDNTPKANPAEVQDWRFVAIPELLNDVSKKPETYTPWFRLILKHRYPAPER
jgi:isopentenyl-diphosphate delta-isomerase